MYENLTYENIMADMLTRVEGEVDKREGSIIYDSLGPTAYYLAEMYFLLEHYPDLIFPDTSAESYLDRFSSAFGIIRKEATKAVRMVTSSAEIAVGTRWQLDETSYIITVQMSELEYEAECEQYGVIGNQYFGPMEPINNGISATVVLEDVVMVGTDEETDDALRVRLLAKMQRPSTSGNVNDYYNWAMSVSGVGAAKIFPLADGPGTVKVVITSEDKTAADNALVQSVFEYIESVRPIGAGVAVLSAVEKVINVSASVSLKDGTYLSTVWSAFESSTEEFLQGKAFGMNYVSLARIGNLLLGIDGVEDYAALTLNGEEINVAIADEEVAVAGAVSLEVM